MDLSSGPRLCRVSMPHREHIAWDTSMGSLDAATCRTKARCRRTVSKSACAAFRRTNGASPRHGSIGRAILNNIRKVQFKGEFGLVNSRYAEKCGGPDDVFPWLCKTGTSGSQARGTVDRGRS